MKIKQSNYKRAPAMATSRLSIDASSALHHHSFHHEHLAH